MGHEWYIRETEEVTIILRGDEDMCWCHPVYGIHELERKKEYFHNLDIELKRRN